MNVVSYNAIDISEIIEKISLKLPNIEVEDFFDSMMSEFVKFDDITYVIVYYDKLLDKINDFIDNDEEDNYDEDELILNELKELNIELDALIALHD